MTPQPRSSFGTVSRYPSHMGLRSCRRFRLALRLQALAVGALVACAGCAHGPEAAPPDPGRADAPPELGVLPRLTPDCSASTPRTHQGMLAARAALQHSMPVPPADRSHARLEAWVGDEVAAWIQSRQTAVEETRYEFRVSGGPSLAEDIVAHAVVGILHEDTAQSIAAIPPPTELDQEPEIADMFAEVMEAKAHPFLSAALVEFRQCVDLAYDGPDDMRHWAYFCQGRFARLRDRIEGARPTQAPAQPDASRASARPEASRASAQ